MIMYNGKEIKTLKIGKQDVCAILLNGRKVFLNEHDWSPNIRQWNTTITINQTRQYGGLSDVVFYWGEQSMLLKYCNKSYREKGSAIIKRTGTAETEQPWAINVPSFQDSYKLEEDEVRVDIATSNVYQNSYYYYAAYCLGAGRRIAQNQGIRYDNCLMQWGGRPVTITLKKFIPSKLVWSFYNWVSGGGGSWYSLKVESTFIDNTGIKVVLYNGEGTMDNNSWQTKEFDFSPLADALHCSNFATLVERFNNPELPPAEPTEDRVELLPS